MKLNTTVVHVAAVSTGDVTRTMSAVDEMPAAVLATRKITGTNDDSRTRMVNRYAFPGLNVPVSCTHAVTADSLSTRPDATPESNTVVSRVNVPTPPTKDQPVVFTSKSGLLAVIPLALYGPV